MTMSEHENLAVAHTETDNRISFSTENYQPFNQFSMLSNMLIVQKRKYH